MKLPACPHCGSDVREYARRSITSITAEYRAHCKSPLCPMVGGSLIYMASYERTVGAGITLDAILNAIRSLPAADQSKIPGLLATQQH